MGITAGCLAILAVAYAIGKNQLRRKLKKRKITMTILLKTRLPMIDSGVFYFAFLPCVISRFANSRLIEFKTRFLSALHMGATSSFYPRHLLNGELQHFQATLQRNRKEYQYNLPLKAHQIFRFHSHHISLCF